VVTDATGLPAVAAAVRAADGSVGLDTETTGLDPLVERVRLIQIATADGVYLIDVFALADARAELADLFAALAGAEVVGHNLLFDLQFLRRLGFIPGKVHDTMLASQVLHAGRDDENGGRLGHKLVDIARRELGLTLDKAEQTSDWSEAELTDEQLRYAATDAAVLLSLPPLTTGRSSRPTTRRSSCASRRGSRTRCRCRRRTATGRTCTR
jgi:DNA polymerase-1